MPVGRALRLLLGIALIGGAVPIYGEVDPRLLYTTAFLIFGLATIYTLLHWFAARRFVGVNRWVGAVVLLSPVVTLYVAGAPGGSVFGRGEGQLAAITFLGVSLLVAAARGDCGCEVMSIPGALLGEPSRMACIVLSPVDWLERKVRGRRAV